MNIKIPLRDYDLDVWAKIVLDSPKIPEIEKKFVKKFIDDLQLGKVNKGIKVGGSRIAKYICDLKILLEYFKKPTTKLTIKDVEQFEKDLTSDKIKTKFGKPYAHSSKVDLKVCLRAYLKWRLKDKAIKLTDWFDTRKPNKTPDYLNEQEITKLFKSCRDNEERFLIAVLFDSGCRAEEFHNIRKEDIQLPKDNENYVKLTLKEEYSKTKGRVISLYWKHSLEAVRDYLKERSDLKSDDKLFSKTYTTSRQTLRRFGEKVLNKNITYHLFRHSSATHYASKINRQQLCYRYGWKFSSPMPDVYISRSGMESKDLDEKFESTELEDLKKELDKEKEEREIQKEGMRNVLKEVQKLKQDIENGTIRGLNKSLT